MGFTSVVRHLSLRGWLRWVHSNRSDATLRVRTRDGGSGRIWCNGGRIIDAEWGTLGAEDALREMLQLASGAVTIDFDRVERVRRIVKATHQLLQVPDGSTLRSIDLTEAETALAAHTGSVRGEPFRNSLFLPLGTPSSQPFMLHPRPDPRRISRGEYLAGVVLLAALAVAAFVFGRIRAASESARNEVEPAAAATEQIKSGLLPPTAQALPEALAFAAGRAVDLPTISFVAIEVDPPRAEVWLDQELVGLGRIELAAIRDGRLHELRFVAPGHETKSVFFRDTPPAGRVILARTSERVPASGAASDSAGAIPSDEQPPENGTTRADDQEQREGKQVARRRAPPLAARARPSAIENPPAAAKSTQAKKSPQVQLIEVHTPRVQVLD